MMALATHKSVSVTAFAHAGMAGFVDRLLADEPIEHLYVFSSQMAQYAPDDRPFVMDFVDMDSEKFAAYGRAAKAPMRWMWQREARRLFHFERETARRAVVSLFVSEAEAALFRGRTKLGEEAVQTLENGIDLDFYRPDNSDERSRRPIAMRNASARRLSTSPCALGALMSAASTTASAASIPSGLLPNITREAALTPSVSPR